MDAPLTLLRADGFEVPEEDIARLSRVTTSTSSAGTPSGFPACLAECAPLRDPDNAED